MFTEVQTPVQVQDSPISLSLTRGDKIGSVVQMKSTRFCWGLVIFVSLFITNVIRDCFAGTLAHSIALSQEAEPHNSSPPSAAYMCRWTGSSLVRVMAWRLFGAMPLPEPMVVYCQLDSWEHISVKFESGVYHFHSSKFIWKCRLQSRGDEITATILYVCHADVITFIWSTARTTKHHMNNPHGHV